MKNIIYKTNKFETFNFLTSFTELSDINIIILIQKSNIQTVMKTIKNAVGLLVLWSGYNIRDSQAVKLANFPQTCEKNLERMESQPE